MYQLAKSNISQQEFGEANHIVHGNVNFYFHGISMGFLWIPMGFLWESEQFSVY